MAQAYVPIQTVTVGSGGAASIEFTNIPGTYTDLLVLTSARSTRNSDTIDDLVIRFNDSTTSYSGRRLYGTGAGVVSDTQTDIRGFAVANNSTASVFSNNTFYIPNYTSSNNKSVSIDGVNENNATTAFSGFYAGLWSNTAAITKITLLANNGNLMQYSTATLYGIGGTRASGGTVTADGRYTYHTFTSTGTFTANENIKGAEVLMIAGGGSGGCNSAGGGGAGGVVNGIIPKLIAGTSYSALVGAGGASVSTFEVKGNNGTASNFSSLTTAVGGGAGGARTSGDNASINNGNSGGSGGGGAGNNPTVGSGGSATSGQGNAGGSGFDSASTFPGGGGGGAGGAGTTATSSLGGDGGAGTSTYSTWGSATSTGQNSGGTYYYAGGGGGAAAWNSGSATKGTGGLGGGGNGAARDVSAGVAGTANTGGGGGGGSNTTTNSSHVSGAGGSGLVIIRYPN